MTNDIQLLREIGRLGYHVFTKSGIWSGVWLARFGDCNRSVGPFNTVGDAALYAAAESEARVTKAVERMRRYLEAERTTL